MTYDLKALRELEKPYFATLKSLPGLDFNREIVEPGANENFPDGCVGIRVDDDFWAVAALPLSYRETPLPEIVKALWPEYAEQASYAPDHGSLEQREYYVREHSKHKRDIERRYMKRLREVEDERDRLRSGRDEWTERSTSKHRRFNAYFIRQYEHLLIAMAHEAKPREDEQKGVCQTCGLLTSDRVHSKKFIDIHAKGYPTWFDGPGNLTDDEDE